MMRRACLSMLLCLPAARASAQDGPPIPLTSDTAQYCAQLAQQITDRHSSLPDVARLLADGRDLCEQGEVRSGLRRLRRALVILHRRKDKPAPPDAAHDKSAEPVPY
jgi:hypothetical protein